MSKPNLPPLPAVPWHQFGGVCANSVAAEAIKNYATAYAEEAVRQALVEAAAICNRKFIAMAEGGFPREASTARRLTSEIVALIPESSSQET